MYQTILNQIKIGYLLVFPTIFTSILLGKFSAIFITHLKPQMQHQEKEISQNVNQVKLETIYLSEEGANYRNGKLQTISGRQPPGVKIQTISIEQWRVIMGVPMISPSPSPSP